MLATLAAVTIVAAIASAAVTPAVSEPVTVTMTVPTSTTIDTTGCANGRSGATTVIADQPTHFWRLGETSGATVAPTVGAISGTNVGTVTRNQPGAFTGSSDPSMGFGGGRTNFSGLTVNTAAAAETTVAFWMRWDGASDVVPFGFQRYALWIDDNDAFGFNSNSSDLWGIDGGATASLKDRWVHIAAVFHNGDVTQSKLYIDGELQTLSKQRFNDPAPAWSFVTANAHLGGHGISSSYRFSGHLDDVAFFTGELGADRIDAHARAGRQGAVDFGAVLPGESSVTKTDCSIEFGSANEQSMLLMYQADRGGAAMVAGSADTLGHWPLNGTMQDVSRTANTGSMNGPPNDPSFVSGDARFGQALHFDGDDFASVPHHPSYSVTSFTVDAWFRTSTIANVPYPQLVNLGPHIFDNQFEMTFKRDDNVLVSCASFSGVHECATASAVGLINGGWHHAAMTLDAASNEMSLYVDGVRQSTTVVPGLVDRPVAPLEIGGRVGSAPHRFNGDIDEVRMTAGALSAADIYAMYVGAVSDYANDGGAGDTDWSSDPDLTGMFGVCLRTVAGSAFTSGRTWQSDVSDADCQDGDDDPWYPVAETNTDPSAKVAEAPLGVTTARANFRFGFRPATNHPAGSWSALVALEVLAPAV